MSRCVRLALGNATGAGLTRGSGLRPANPGAVTQPQGWNAKARTNLGCRCPVPGQKCHSGLFSRGHYFFLTQLNTSSGGCGEGRQSQQEHVGSSALLWLRSPSLWTQGRAFGTRTPCRSSFSCHLPPRLLAQLVFPAGPYAQLLTHWAFLVPQRPGGRSPVVPRLYLPLCYPAIQPQGILLTSSFSSKKLKTLCKKLP